MKQADRVLEYMQRNGSITSLEAIERLGVIQLPRRIYDLKHRGLPITTDQKMVSNRYGQRVRIAVYRMEATA